MNKKECIATVNRRFAEYKSQNRIEEDRRRREIGAAAPEYQDIDRKLQALHGELFRVILEDHPDEELLEAVKNRSLALQSRQKELLMALGRPADYLEPVYHCQKCKDEGVLDGVLCECYKRALAEEYLRASGMDGLFAECTFRKFDVTLFPEGSSREQMNKLLEFSKKYVRTFSSASPSLLFSGTPGCGKTFLSICIGCGLIRQGVFVLYAPVQTMIADLEAATFRNGDPSLPPSEYLEAELLILDDLGTEFYSSFVEAKLYEILNTRIVKKKPTVISTNLTPSEREETYSARVNSRLNYSYMNLNFPSADLRRAQKERRSKS